MPSAPTRFAELKWTDTKIALRYELAIADPRPQGDKDIVLAGHDHAIAVPGEHLFKALRDVERHLLFRDPLARNTAAIVTPMASIDYDSRG